MSKAVERVARVLAMKLAQDPDEIVASSSRMAWEYHTDKARAAIAAILDDMEEPSEGVEEAGAMVSFRCGGKTIYTPTKHVRRQWKAALAQYRKETLG